MFVEDRDLAQARSERPSPGSIPIAETPQRETSGISFTADAINRLVKTIGERAKLPFGVHAHMLRHACGYALANAGHDTRLIQDWLGHRAIQHTARYTELSPTRFRDVWR